MSLSFHGHSKNNPSKASMIWKIKSERFPGFEEWQKIDKHPNETAVPGIRRSHCHPPLL
jgi:hypothetical protein